MCQDTGSSTARSLVPPGLAEALGRLGSEPCPSLVAPCWDRSRTMSRANFLSRRETFQVGARDISVARCVGEVLGRQWRTVKCSLPRAMLCVHSPSTTFLTVCDPAERGWTPVSPPGCPSTVRGAGAAPPAFRETSSFWAARGCF